MIIFLNKYKMENLGVDILEKISENVDFLTFINLFDALNKEQKEIVFGLLQFDKIAEKQFIKILQECIAEFLEITNLVQFDDLDKMYDLSKYGFDKDLGKKILKIKTKQLYNSLYGEKLIKVFPEPEKTNLYLISKNKKLDKSIRTEANRQMRKVIQVFEIHKFESVLNMLTSLNFKEILNLYLSLKEYYGQDSMMDRTTFDNFIFCVERKLKYMVSKFNRAIDFKTAKILTQTLNEYKASNPRAQPAPTQSTTAQLS
jgi:hypothetical protein